MSEDIINLIEIKDFVSADLAVRELADLFFSRLEMLPDDQISVSFSDIRSITRSFAHQFIMRKKFSKKRIDVVNLPLHVQKMFKLIEEDTPRHQSRKVLDLDSMQVVSL